MKVDAATNAMIFDILKNILSFAEKPDELGKYITTQLRELVGAKMVLLILNSEDQQQNNHKLIGICPERKRERIELNHVQQIATLCQSFHVPTLVEHSDNAGETGKLLMHFTGNTSIIVPLEYASKSIGVLLMIDIFDTNNLSSVLDSLESLSGVLALELRNGQFFEILKSEVEKRTIELHESEEKFHRYIERAPDGILVIDSNGYYIDVNKAACDLLGYNRAEILTMHASKIRLAEESKKVNHYIDFS